MRVKGSLCRLIDEANTQLLFEQTKDLSKLKLIINGLIDEDGGSTGIISRIDGFTQDGVAYAPIVRSFEIK